MIYSSAVPVNVESPRLMNAIYVSDMFLYLEDIGNSIVIVGYKGMDPDLFNYFECIFFCDQVF